MKGIIAFNDLHCGSIYGMLPPDFVNSEGKVVNQNAGQKYLWQCWDHYTTAVSKFKKDILAIVVDGDLIDGTQHCQRGTELSLPLLADQSQAAAETIQHLTKHMRDIPLYIVGGTEYHDSKAFREVEVIAATLGAQTYQGPGPGRLVKRQFDCEYANVRFNFLHGISVATGFYRATAIDREGAFASLATREKIHVVYRAHAHNYVAVKYKRRWNVQAPCWQLQTGFMAKNSAFRMLPDIGGLVIWVDEAKAKAGVNPVSVQDDWMYDLPPLSVTKL